MLLINTYQRKYKTMTRNVTEKGPFLQGGAPTSLPQLFWTLQMEF
jgi:hypothetical protein